MKNKTLSLLFGLLLLGGISLLWTKRSESTALAQTSPDLSKISLKACITLPAELPAVEAKRIGSHIIEPRKRIATKADANFPVFFHRAAWDAHGIGAGTYFDRLSDQMMLSVDAAVCPTEAETKAITDEARLTQTGLFPEGSFSKRSMGQHVYSHLARNGKFLSGQYRVIIQDGHARIDVSALTKTLNVNGWPVPTELATQDAVLCEDIALRVLDRLTAMGHTSKPANSASNEARKQVLDWIAANPDASTFKP